MSTPLISIIVPVYNTEKYLHVCLEHLCNQSYKNIEIICIDDGSTDNSPTILKEYAKKDSRIRLFFNKHKGQGAARNTGIAVSKGEFITGIDSDDYIVENAYEKLVPYLTPDIDVLVFGTVIEGESDPEKLRRDTEYYRLKHSGLVDITPDVVMETDGSFWNKLWRKSVIEKWQIKFPESMWYEDAAFYFMCMCSCRKAYYCEQTPHRYIRRQGSIMHLSLNHAAKVLDHLRIVPYVYRHLVKIGYMEKYPQLLLRIFRNAFWFSYRLCPDSHKEQLKIVANDVIHECELNKLYPNDDIVKKHYKRMSIIHPLKRSLVKFMEKYL